MTDEQDGAEPVMPAALRAQDVMDIGKRVADDLAGSLMFQSQSFFGGYSRPEHKFAEMLQEFAPQFVDAVISEMKVAGWTITKPKALAGDAAPGAGEGAGNGN